ncbi:CHAT domain-containing protein [Lyngbya sp. CCY1209]|uniref:CHAT domain-containing protein n=1 Tax=Lyngbya sp. CCY1209 TaxID=2886103 RepID=UPI002D2028DF|nr:CHAT domain-containing protein [Lyngbya sp. CCY1209]MEB3884146.1 CHAT domain-containing protein [Lyngbya sp. CCY1209]
MKFWNGIDHAFTLRLKHLRTRFFALSLGVCLLLVALSVALGSLETPAQSLSEKILEMERGIEREYEDYFGRDIASAEQPPEAIAKILARLGEQTGTTPAVLWAIPRTDYLHLVLITPDAEPIVRDLFDVPEELIESTARIFRQNVTRLRPPLQLEAARKLYEWIVAPFEAEYLQPAGVDTLLFCLGSGLRTTPMVALHDGEQFLIEKYSLTRIPAFNLIDTDYKPLRLDRILAMGASEFQTLEPLPAVPVELSAIAAESQSRTGESGEFFLNREFTTQNLKDNLAEQSFDIVHWATHAAFNSGSPKNSYIQFWDAQITLHEIRNIPWNNSPPELLVLSACQTALGDPEAELGFAGLALQAGVKSAVASLWNVSDLGTLALMAEFYRQLAIAPTKAEALRQAQIHLLRGDVRFEGDRLLLGDRAVPLPENLKNLTPSRLDHPFYWAGFSLISSPW